MHISEAKRIAVLAGDGIGPEVMHQALSVLEGVSSRFNRKMEFVTGLVGGAAFEVHGAHFPDETREICQQADAILFGSVGGPITESHLAKWQGCEANSILAIRRCFGLAANFRPTVVYPELIAGSPLKADVIGGGIDLMIIRELQGDLYFGEHTMFTRDGERCARDSGEYTEEQIALVARFAFTSAEKRRGVVHSVDKANVLSMSKLWREVVREVHGEFRGVKLEEILVDNCALQLVRRPRQFDVILAPNLFGDILSDLAAALPGSLGLSPSASFNSKGFALYEPSGGSAPDIAGKGVCNPIAQILCAAMMLRHSFNWEEEAKAVEGAVRAAISDGFRTADISNRGDSGEKVVGTTQMGAEILRRLVA